LETLLARRRARNINAKSQRRQRPMEDDQQVESGDAEAMREVRRWRIDDEVGLPGRH
jgi:hypothetical protein